MSEYYTLQCFRCNNLFTSKYAFAEACPKCWNDMLEKHGHKISCEHACEQTLELTEVVEDIYTDTETTELVDAVLGWRDNYKISYPNLELCPELQLTVEIAQRLRDKKKVTVDPNPPENRNLVTSTITNLNRGCSHEP